MARPQSVSDEAILSAAQRVISQRGYDAFTLSEVADEVGLSRAAIILRFKSTQALKLRLTSEAVDRFVQSIEALPLLRNGDGLLDLASFIGARISDRSRVGLFFRMHRANLGDKELAEIEHKRERAWRCAISDRMPKVSISHESAVAAFAAHLAGSILSWEAESERDGAAYLVKRTEEWLTLAHIPFGRRSRSRRADAAKKKAPRAVSRTGPFNS